MSEIQPNSVTLSVAVVAGDICLDVLGLPIPPTARDATVQNWRQTGETRTFYRRGGTWLLADFLEAALKVAGVSGVVVQPVAAKLTEDLFEKSTRQEIVHSLLSLGDFTDKHKN